ncbi:DUF805 domain-containing protein [Streptococcus salivarius]|uniref:DUF805 domain-containing protein n=1 Tax=Streptococcus salivarius TaxID=1304 RepID=A0AB37DBQ4_STRSL|nr:DUF805 domain-containing protein [Streptococcus salivarius]QGU81235.1 DUF805 domain-containing protein [Streptococcus salivarius]RGS21190.1 DUF805 domain-containing protein [Streptococcus salivarius]
MIEAYKKFWEGYVDFEGRSTRSDYWFAYLVNALITWGLYIVVAVFGGIASATDSTVLAIFSLILGLIMFIYAVAAFLPGLAVTVRRLRDAGYNWPYIFVAFIPLVGWIILIVLLCKPSKVEYPFNNFNNPQQ